MLQNLLIKLGTEAGYEVLYHAEPEIWIIKNATGQRIDISFDQEESILTCLIVLAHIREGRERHIHQRFLRYNMMTVGGGRPYFALGASDRPVMIHRCVAHQLDLPLIDAAVSALFELAAAWTELLDETPEPQPIQKQFRPIGGIAV